MSKPLSERQKETLRVVAEGRCTNPFYGNSNVDNRSLQGLKTRGLIVALLDPWRVEITDAGKEALT